jgi:extradiol dioxygenase family protein
MLKQPSVKQEKKREKERKKDSYVSNLGSNDGQTTVQESRMILLLDKDEEENNNDNTNKTIENYSFTRQHMLRRAFDISSFNHMSREVSDVEQSAYFYINILGFQSIPRPEFEVSGEWLWGHGLNFHIIKTSNKEARENLRRRRIKYFHDNLPSVDHIAFLAKDCHVVRSLLQEEDIYFREFTYPKTGIHQLFFFDPDGNAIEVSNCAPPIGKTRCALSTPHQGGALEDLCHLEANAHF